MHTPTLRSRIAPTPSGYLHVGNAFNFILTWLMVRRQGGILRLRIDDLDQERVRDEYLEDIFETLEWLGLDWDEGPTSVSSHKEHFSQSLRLPLYEKALQKLEEQGATFACECSRRQIKKASQDGQYPGTCRDKHLPYTKHQSALRIVTPQGKSEHWQDLCLGQVEVELYKEMRDFVLKRKDGWPAYQIASLADDTDHQIQLIVRGEDLLQSTAAQLHLASLLGEPFSAFSDAHFYHHHLLLDQKGQKLSKSAGATSLRSWRATQSVEDFYRWLSRHWLKNTECHHLQELLSYTKTHSEFFADIITPYI